MSTPYQKNSYSIDAQRSKYNNERVLYKKLLAEAYNHFGVDMTYYIVSYDTSYDKIFGEDNNRRFIRKFDAMSYYILPREEDIFTKFGIEGIDLFHLYISIEHFRVSSTTGYTSRGAYSFAFCSSFDASRVIQDGTGILTYNVYTPYIPKAGDIIKSKFNNYYYEILTVKNTINMFLQGFHSWDIIVRPYKDSHWILGPSVSEDDIKNFTDTTDVFNISGAIETEKQDVLYQPSVIESINPDTLVGW